MQQVEITVLRHGEHKRMHGVLDHFFYCFFLYLVASGFVLVSGVGIADGEWHGLAFFR